MDMAHCTEAIQKSTRFNNRQLAKVNPRYLLVQPCHWLEALATGPLLLPPAPALPVAVVVAVAMEFVKLGKAAFVGVGKFSVSLYSEAE
jgi:hypothetical protein